MSRPAADIEDALLEQLRSVLADDTIVYAELARAQAALHALPVDGFQERLRDAGYEPSRLHLEALVERLAGSVDAHQLAELRPAIRWLYDELPGGAPVSICHGDFFPNQVFEAGGAITGVVDGMDIRIAPPRVRRRGRQERARVLPGSSPGAPLVRCRATPAPGGEQLPPRLP